MSSILLCHAEGQDREALFAYLNKAGYHVSGFASLGDLESRVDGGFMDGDLPVVILQESFLPEALDLSFLDGFPVLVLGRRRRVTTSPPPSRLDDPYFLNTVLAEVERLATGKPAVAADAVAGEVPDDGDLSSSGSSTSDSGLLLRGIAHALNNPLSAASGWLQLLAVDLGEADSRVRALNQVRGEMHRLERLLQALGLIGGRPSNLRAAFDVSALVEERVLTLEREGLPVTFSLDPNLPRIPGDPGEFSLMLDLVLGSFLEERGRVQQLDVHVARRGSRLVLTLEERGGTLPGSCDPRDLGILLRRCRHGRAIGIALAAHLVGEWLGGDARLESEEDGLARFELSIPAMAPADGGHGNHRELMGDHEGGA